jgi:Holliday junction resolvase
MSDFRARLAGAVAHERAVLSALRDAGWQAFAFGQGLLGDAERKMLQTVDTNIRWCPDILAIKDRVLVSVDAKAGERWKDTIDLGRPGSFRGNGSGTPFMLIKATDCVPFDEIFGSYV